MRKRKLTKQEKAAKKLRQQNFMYVFIRGKQKRVRRPPMVEGLAVDEFIKQNADPVWLHQNEMWELLEPEERDKHDESPQLAWSEFDRRSGFVTADLLIFWRSE